jgi:DNA (cytosine-5)-methyltransferase 1
VDAARIVFCDFETRNTGGCDLTKAGAWRYAIDPATEVICFGYRVDGADHSWAPVSGSLVAAPSKPPKASASDRRLRALDLCCCAGGAARGLMEAGIHVTGVDLEKQLNYCGDVLIQMDALEFLRRAIEDGSIAEFDYIHASPPCKFFTELKRSFKVKKHDIDLITPIRPLLVASGLPWVIENVMNARRALRNPIMLCGSMFPGLETATHQLQRHRLFETSFPLTAPGPCRHNPHKWVGGIFGGHIRDRKRPEAGAPNPEPRLEPVVGGRVRAHGGAGRQHDAQRVERGNTAGLFALCRRAMDEAGRRDSPCVVNRNVGSRVRIGVHHGSRLARSARTPRGRP